MSASTRIDVNYLSIGADGCAIGAGGPDAVNIPFPTDFDLSKIDGSKYASLLKISGRFVGEVSDAIAPQGKECAVDINTLAVVTLQGHFGSDNNKFGDQIFSVKGGAKAIIKGVLHGAGIRMKADVLVDNWADLIYDGSTVDLTEVSHVSGRKINVVKRYGASNVILGKNAKVDVIRSIGLTVYWWAKCIVRAVLRIPKGVKGPSWI